MPRPNPARAAMNIAAPAANPVKIENTPAMTAPDASHHVRRFPRSDRWAAGTPSSSDTNSATPATAVMSSVERPNESRISGRIVLKPVRSMASTRVWPYSTTSGPRAAPPTTDRGSRRRRRVDVGRFASDWRNWLTPSRKPSPRAARDDRPVSDATVTCSVATAVAPARRAQTGNVPPASSADRPVPARESLRRRGTGATPQRRRGACPARGCPSATTANTRSRSPSARSPTRSIVRRSALRPPPQ